MPMAFFKPGWASEMTSWTPSKAPGLERTEGTRPEGLGLAVAHVEPQELEEGAGKNDPCRSLGIFKFRSPGRCRQYPRPGGVAMGGAVAGPLETAGADEDRGLNVDEFPVRRLGRDADTIGNRSALESCEQVKQSKLI
jgi:hypothetical protein